MKNIIISHMKNKRGKSLADISAYKVQKSTDLGPEKPQMHSLAAEFPIIFIRKRSMEKCLQVCSSIFESLNALSPKTVVKNNLWKHPLIAETRWDSLALQSGSWLDPRKLQQKFMWYHISPLYPMITCVMAVKNLFKSIWSLVQSIYA